MALLAATALTAAPVWADGGAGGHGGAGGVDSTTGIGGSGASGVSFAGGGGGGGAGAAGGNGGAGLGSSGGPGASVAGGNGVAGSDGGDGGGGGGGGAHRLVTSVLSNGGTLQGGSGGIGGNGVAIDGGGGGGGGSGGYGVVVSGSSANVNSGSLLGGAGGDGGTAFGEGNEAGDGGGGGIGAAFAAGTSGTFSNSTAGIVAGGTGGTGGEGGQSMAGPGLTSGGVGGAGFTGSGVSIVNAGQINGGPGGPGGFGSGSLLDADGAGGAGGAGISGSSLTITNTGSITGGGGGISGAGGAAISGSGLTIINSGTITGGSPVSGGAQADAITFTGGANTLTLQPGSTITGNVVAFSAADTLALGGSGMASFAVSQIGPAAQYQNFGVLQKTGSSTWTLTGTTSATTSWAINGGTLAISSDSNLGAASGTLSFNGGALQTTSTLSTSRTVTLNAGGGTLSPTAGTTLSMNGAIGGTGGLAVNGPGTVILAGANSYIGPTTVTGSGLIVNGSLVSTVTLDSNSAIGGSGTIGGLMSNGATLAPGNSIGTLTVTGNFSQSGGAYVVEVNAQGQGDRVNVSGTATINGASLQLIEARGNYGTSTTYTILNATGGVSGTYSSVSENFAFLTPSLSYDANNVFLTLALQGNAFSGFDGNTVNQRSVGYALDQAYASATGDFATVIGALAGLNTQQGPYALNQISGQPYTDFGSFNVANNALFMNALGQQMALTHGGRASGQRLALAEACDVASCDGTSPFSVWVSALGGVGSVQGDGNSSTFTYNVGGAAAGIDYRPSPSFLVGLGAGYTNGTQWVDSFQGKGWSNTVSVAAYASFTQWSLYVDALAGYAYSNNQLQRQIFVPGLQPRTANGSTGATQFLGQVEAGYKIGVYAPAMASVTPFARFQTSSINQAAFSEWGANSLSLNVQQQTTTSVRTVLGAELAGAIGLGDTRTLDLGLRLGWLHEYANTARPITAAFAGAPSASFTVYGATPQRDAAVIGFQASTAVAAATQLYLRYDGDIGSGTDNHALNLGVRLSW